MRLSSVHIQNFRAFSDETINFNGYTCLVGPNGGGKSTVLQALNVFFQETSHSKVDLLKLDKEDFHHKNIADPIVITVTFEDLSPEAQEDLKDYYRQGKLIVSAKAEWNDEDKYAQVLQYGLRMGMEDFKPFFKADGDKASVKELREQYAEIREQYGDLPAPGTKQAMIDALRKYEAQHPELCIEIPSEDQFYGVSKGANRLSKYIQWVFIPAVKDASDEERESKKTALGALLERTVRMTVGFKEPLDAIRKEAGAKYQKALIDNQESLKALSDSLSLKLGQWAHPDTSIDVQWHYDEGASVEVTEPYAMVVAGEGAFKGKLTRFGHGMQRSFLLALLEELAAGAAGGPKLILGCEEPELYQHPPQARHLSSVFQQLATNNSQVIVCTHSPYFVSGREVEDIRSIRPDSFKKCCCCHQVTFDQVATAIATASGEKPAKPVGMMLKIQQALQPELNELFFTNALILVEGLEDIAYISTYLTLMDKWSEFRKLGCHIVPVGGKSELARPIAIAQRLRIPTFVVFDSDGHSVPKPGDPDPNGVRSKHEYDNNTVLKLCGIAAPNPFPADTLWNPSVVMWKHEIGEVVIDDLGKGEWTAIKGKVRKDKGIYEGGINKNSLFVGYCLGEAWGEGKKSKDLQRLCTAILDFAGAARKPTSKITTAPAP